MFHFYISIDSNSNRSRGIDPIFSKKLTVASRGTALTMEEKEEEEEGDDVPPHVLLKKKVGTSFCELHDIFHSSSGDSADSSQGHSHSHTSHSHHSSVDDKDPNIVHLKETVKTFIEVDYDGKRSSGATSKVHQLCIAKHALHFHSITFELNNTLGDCDVFVTLGDQLSETPSASQWDWKSSDIGHDTLLLRTYTSDFIKYDMKIKSKNSPFHNADPNAKPGPSGDSSIPINLSELKQKAALVSSQNTQSYPLFFSISSKDPAAPCACTLGVTISPLGFTDIAHTVGALRGGQVLLPRDVKTPYSRSH